MGKYYFCSFEFALNDLKSHYTLSGRSSKKRRDVNNLKQKNYNHY